jgi:hypothetical protein
MNIEHHKNHTIRINDVPVKGLPSDVTCYRLRIFERVSGVQTATCIAFERHTKIGQNEIHVLGIPRPFKSMNNATVSILERKHHGDVPNTRLLEMYENMPKPSYGLRVVQPKDTPEEQAARKAKQAEIVKALSHERRASDFRNETFASRQEYARNQVPMFDAESRKRIERDLEAVEREERANPPVVSEAVREMTKSMHELLDATYARMSQEINQRKNAAHSFVAAE